MREEKLSIYRILPMIGIFFSITATAFILCVINKRGIDEMLCVAFIVLSFMPILIFELGYERRRGFIGNNTQTTYSRIALGVFISCVFTLVISFMPQFFRPVLLLSVLITAFSNEVLGITIAFFLNVLLAVTTSGSLYELLAYILLIIIGGILAKVLQQVEYRLYVSLIFVFCSIAIPNVFYYLANEEISLLNLGICFINGVITGAYVIAGFPKQKMKTEEEIVFCYEKILEDDYVQVRAVRSYAWSEYRHARKVSDIARKYANKLGMRAELAAAAGFYYRLGRWEGEPFIENAIKKAKELCFPDELITILSEYYGDEKLPSTPESALVHIIDGLIIKLELLENEVGTSKWNKEVLISQTLNEFSTAGLYDKSGLSINAFIKIREWLIREELL